MEPRRSKHFLAHIPTIALLVVFAMSPWLGILFFILHSPMFWFYFLFIFPPVSYTHLRAHARH